MYHGQVPAALIAHHGHHVGVDGLGGAGRAPAALNPAGRHIQGPAHTGQPAHRCGEFGATLDEPGRTAEPAEVDIHVGERHLPGESVCPPKPGQREMLG